ncbi:hypothetical protein D8780_14950 [Notoacmeibacter ruber]|uniref:Integrase catalytic domain-containing protein n=1 Tax=Notoacmeibacter ruber TaxID=2670375 RepID=A0A3L7J4D7_9HYPH|nr:hypothetical protein D8780_14950 [Notoacmeibacter ruber]
MPVRVGAASRHSCRTGLLRIYEPPRQPYDNAKAESFMKTLKVEDAYLIEYESFDDVATGLPRFIEAYNNRRLRMSIRRGALQSATRPRRHTIAAEGATDPEGAPFRTPLTVVLPCFRLPAYMSSRRAARKACRISVPGLPRASRSAAHSSPTSAIKSSSLAMSSAGRSTKSTP